MTRRAVLAVLAATAAVVWVTLPLAAADAQTAVERRSGPDRYGTAAAVSRAAFSPGVPVVHVATGLDFADALAAGPAAAVAGGPVLLVTRTAVPQPTRDELQRLQPRRVVVLGGGAAVSAEVEAELRTITGAPVERIAGPDRYGTAARISTGAFPTGVPVAHVATGQAFPDALAGAAAAAANGGPVLLVTRDAIPPATLQELRRLAPRRIVVLGGPTAISPEVERELAASTSGEVTRLAGADRYATATAVSAATFAPGRPVVHLATGRDFPDALAGSAVSAGGPVLLVPGTCVPDGVRAEMDRLAPGRIVVLGGTAAVAERVERLAPCGVAQVVVTRVASGLARPWSVAFAPDGRAFISERDTARLLVRDPGGAVREVQRVPGVNAEGEGGLLGLAVSPSFADDGLVYAYVTTASDNRIVRLVPGSAPEPILTGIPRASHHNGGRIAFGPDGMLYVATGDAGQSNLAQDAGSLAGKILRVTPDGVAPAGNPFAGSPVWSVGHRNVQGLAWDAGGRLFATEFGPNRDDEINHITPGSNFGWPLVTGMAGDPRFVDPIEVRQPPEASWSGAVVLRDSAIPQWEGSLFAAGLRGTRLWRLTLDGARVTGTEQLLVGEYGRLRDVVQAPDGSLWVLTNDRSTGDLILRLGPPD